MGNLILYVKLKNYPRVKGVTHSHTNPHFECIPTQGCTTCTTVDAASWSTCEGFSAATQKELLGNAVPAKYPQHTFTAAVTTVALPYMNPMYNLSEESECVVLYDNA